MSLPPASTERPSPGVVALLFAAVVAATARPIIDPDFWWHLRTGQRIVEEGIPRVDPYSFTVPGRTWVTHEWLSEVVLWTLWSRLGGAVALIIFFTALATSAFWLAYRTSFARRVPTAVVAALASWAAAVATGVRPQMFNLFGLAVVLWACERIRVGSQPIWKLGWLVPLTIIWANLHSGYLLGVAVLGVYAVAELITRRTKPALGIGAVTAACFAGAAINPSGVAMWRYPFDTLRSPVMRDFIAEWASPDFHAPVYAPFLVLLVISVVSVVASKMSLPAAHALLLGGTGVASLQSVRHIAVFAIVTVPVISPHLAAAYDRVRTTRRQRSGSAQRDPAPGFFQVGIRLLGGLVGAAMLAGAVSSNDLAQERTLPVAAVDYLESSGLAESRGFNQYRFGGYLIWRDIPVFIDGRADVYGDEFLSTYVDTHRVAPNWSESLDANGVQWVLVEPDHALTTMLTASADWEPAPGWEDTAETDVATIFRRSVGVDSDRIGPTPNDLAFGGE